MSSIFNISIGFILLLLGSNLTITGTKNIALKLNMPKLIVATIIIGFGTSMPELMVSITSSFEHIPDIALGNVVGSNITNVFLILGLASLILPLDFNENILNIIFLIVSTVTLFLLMLFNLINVYFSIMLLLTFLCFIYFTLKNNKADDKSKNLFSKENKKDKKIEFDIFFIGSIIISILGIFLLIYGANKFVNGAVEIAKFLNISDYVIGLTVVALGTSLPELFSAIVSSFKKENDLIIGNIIGSNIFNVYAIMGFSGLINPITVDYKYIFTTGIFFLLSAGIIAYYFLKTGKTNKNFSISCLILYVVYIITTIYI